MAGLLCAACSVGAGEGEVMGKLSIDSCDLENAAYEMNPSFFGADDVEELLEIRLQRGSDRTLVSDGLMILVSDAALVKQERLGQDIDVEVDNTSLVQMGLYLNDTCPSDPNGDQSVFVAVSGSIRFDEIYAPKVDDDDTNISATFSEVRFEDPSDPDQRNATLSGFFEFIFNRGRPAQLFP